MTSWSSPDTALRLVRLLALLPLCVGTVHAACGEPLRNARVIQGANYRIAYVAHPAKIPVGHHFNLDVVACPSAGAPPPDALRMDARMPEHGHGMAYQAQAHPTGPGRWRVEGLMLHMQGKWTFQFDVSSGDRVERISEDLVLR